MKKTRSSKHKKVSDVNHLKKDIKINNSKERKKKNKSRIREYIWGTFLVSLVILCLLSSANLILRKYVIKDVFIDGTSMESTLHNNDIVTYVKANSFIPYEPQRFRIVVFNDPRGSGEQYIKRVIGMPNDEVEYRNNKLYINGIYYEEPYLDDHKLEGMEMLNFKVKVPSGAYFVMGDNRLVSEDSRDFGSISKSSIIGVKTPHRIPNYNFQERQLEKEVQEKSNKTK